MTTHAPAEPLIRAEISRDQGEIRTVHALAFGDSERVPDLVDALRTAKAALTPLSFVATLGDRIAGHVMLSACRLDALSRLVDVYSLSPLGVLPEHQGRGIGTRLIEHALAAADQQGIPLVFVEGSPRYYGKRGFRAAQELGFRAPTLRYPPGAFQVAALSAYQDWMTGTFVYAETFWALDCVGLREPRLSASALAGEGVFLDGDWCRDMRPFVVTGETIAMVNSNISYLLNGFLGCPEFENVIFCWVLHEQPILDDLIDALNVNGCTTHCFSLVSTEQALAERLNSDIPAGRRGSDITERSVARISLYAELDTVKIDVSTISPADAARRITEHMACGQIGGYGGRSL